MSEVPGLRRSHRWAPLRCNASQATSIVTWYRRGAIGTNGIFVPPGAQRKYLFGGLAVEGDIHGGHVSLLCNAVNL